MKNEVCQEAGSCKVLVYNRRLQEKKQNRAAHMFVFYHPFDLLQFGVGMEAAHSVTEVTYVSCSSRMQQLLLPLCYIKGRCGNEGTVYQAV
ncbi:hypothetical protein ATANTOWER_000149 [Ataeniobius toweri]|uniref:Uncharacterized protein n=1 Tax=Ataeniobius toweri TaxID=208326 RepID=A0ABU7AV74_9TELE|nr:hypothetical protein [Ataeniobius toweri]